MVGRFPVRPVPRRDAEAGDLVDRSAAVAAVEDELSEFPLHVGLHVKEFEPRHLRVHRERLGASEAGVSAMPHATVPMLPSSKAAPVICRNVPTLTRAGRLSKPALFCGVAADRRLPVRRV